MKASEALEMLKLLNPNTEVTLILGDLAIKNSEFSPVPAQPYWVPQNTRRKNEITCNKVH